MRSARHLANAALAGAVLALASDLLLQGALALVRVGGSGTSWLFVTLMERGRWVMAAALVAAAAPRLASLVWPDTGTATDDVVNRSVALRAIAVAMLTLPVIWALATILLRAAGITFAGDWSVDGRLFLSEYFYSSLLIGYAPWAMAAAALIAIAAHVAPDS
jgi:hypothetical protein